MKATVSPGQTQDQAAKTTWFTETIVQHTSLFMDHREETNNTKSTQHKRSCCRFYLKKFQSPSSNFPQHNSQPMGGSRRLVATVAIQSSAIPRYCCISAHAESMPATCFQVATGKRRPWGFAAAGELLEIPGTENIAPSKLAQLQGTWQDMTSSWVFSVE